MTFLSGERKHHLKCLKLFKHNVQNSIKKLPGIPVNKTKSLKPQKKNRVNIRRSTGDPDIRVIRYVL